MGVARRIAGLCLMAGGAALALAALLTPWLVERLDETSCYSVGQCEERRVDLRYGASEVEIQIVGENEQTVLHRDYRDLRAADHVVAGRGLANSGWVVSVVGAALAGVGLVLALMGLYLHPGLAHAGAWLGAGAAVALAVGAALLAWGITDINGHFARDPDPEGEFYVEGDAVDRRGLRPHVGIMFAGAAFLLVAGGSSLVAGPEVVATTAAAASAPGALSVPGAAARAPPNRPGTPGAPRPPPTGANRTPAQAAARPPAPALRNQGKT